MANEEAQFAHKIHKKGEIRMKKICYFLCTLLLFLSAVGCQSSVETSSSSSENRTGPWVNWSESYTTFSEFDTFFQTLKSKKNISILSLRMEDTQSTEYIFDGGVINAETSEELETAFDYAFTFSITKEWTVEQKVKTTDPSMQNVYTISGESVILAKEEQIVLSELVVECIEQNVYVVKQGEKTVMKFSLCWQNESFAVDDILVEVQAGLIQL